MSSKYDDDFDCKSEGKDNDRDCYYDGKEDKDANYDPPKITVTGIKINPSDETNITDPLSIKIDFELDRDVVAGYWVVQLLVDSSHNRIIHKLGETAVEDYPDGESEMFFTTDKIDIDGISPSTLTNSGLLMALFMVDGEEVASVNMVSNHSVLSHAVFYQYVFCHRLSM